MDTRKIATEYRLTQWAKIIQARQESGLNIKQFCEAQGIKSHIYFYWQRKVREAACTGLAKQKSSGNLVPQGWVQLAAEHQQQKQH